MLAAWTSTTTSPGPGFGSGASPSCNTSGPPCFVNRTAFIVCSRLLLPSQKFNQQLAHAFRLLLVHPMAGTLDQVTTQHPRAHALLHPLEIAGTLIGPPIAPSGDEHRRHVYGPAREQLQLGGVDAARSAPVPLQAARERGALVLCGVDRELRLRRRPACCDLGRRRHLG